jgi:hypothetical protein
LGGWLKWEGAWEEIDKSKRCRSGKVGSQLRANGILAIREHEVKMPPGGKEEYLSGESYVEIDILSFSNP